MTFGTIENARLAADLDRRYHREYGFDGNTDDFKKVGEGAYRRAYLHVASNIVYKVTNNGNSNVDEATNYRKIRSRSVPGINFRIPRTRTFRVKDNRFGRNYVVAQEYAVGATTTMCRGGDTNWDGSIEPCTCNREECFNDIRRSIQSATGLLDCHSENVLYNKDTDTFWLIDLCF